MNYKLKKEIIKLFVPYSWIIDDNEFEEAYALKGILFLLSLVFLPIVFPCYIIGRIVSKLFD